MLKKTGKKLLAVLAMAVVVLGAGLVRAQAAGDTVLKNEDLHKLLPAQVYYKGQSAPTQLRNAGGIRFADGYYVLAALVDTSGYSTAAASRYQAYFVVETPILIGGEKLLAGVYGAGFVDDKFVITDVGGHDVLTVATGNDEGIKRPMPLQVQADPGGGYRLYAGRHYVQFSR